MFRRQKDLRCEPVARIVALGESTTWGFCVSSKDKCWVSLVAAMIAESQGSGVECINQGIGSNVLTTRCPSYRHSIGPAALERVQGDVIDLRPDLLLLSYGLNDSRGGTSPEDFAAEYQKLIDTIRAKIDPLIVLVNTYYMHEWLYDNCPNWEQSDYEVTEVFNDVIGGLAEANGLILADIYAAEVGVDWIIDPDHCHANDLGHRLIANRVFEAICRNCSFPARTMPRDSLGPAFLEKYINGPDRPGPAGRSDGKPPFRLEA